MQYKKYCLLFFFPVCPWPKEKKMHAAQTHFGPPVMHDFGLVMDTNMCGHHQTHFHWANGQSWKKEADSKYFCTACNKDPLQIYCLQYHIYN